MRGCFINILSQKLYFFHSNEKYRQIIIIIKMCVGTSGEGDLDTIFAEIGEFGFYQIAIFLLISIPNALSVTFIMNYMFAANTLDYR